jgi:hypothetical protein
MKGVVMTSRRQFLVNSASLALLSSAARAIASSPSSKFLGRQAESVPSEVSSEQWMNEWMNQTKRSESGNLFLSRFVEPMYFLTAPITWTPNEDQHGYERVTVPVGFVTDLASIPRTFYSALRPDGEYAYAAIIHDYLYWTQSRPRETADMIFKFAMQDFEVGPMTVGVIYKAVRVAGGASWDEDERLKRGGEKRILKIFPSAPNTRWANFKNNPQVFADS